MEEDGLQLALALGLGRRRVEQPALHRHLPDSRPVHASAVVGQGQHHPASLLLGTEGEPAGAGLAAPLPQPRGLDAVVDGVPHQVNQGIAQLLHQPLVELDLPPAGLEHHVLARLASHPPDQPLEPVEQLLQRNHPGLEQALLEDVQPPHELPVLAEKLGRPGARRELACLGQRADGLAGQPQLAHRVDQSIEAGDVDPQRLSGGPAFQRRLDHSQPARVGARLAKPEGSEPRTAAGEGALERLLSRAGADQEEEGQSIDAPGDRARQGGDQLPDPVEAGLHRLQLLVEGVERILHLHLPDQRALAERLPEPVLLELGEHPPHVGGQLQPVQRILGLAFDAPLAPGELPGQRPGLLRWTGGVGGQPAEDFHRLEEQIQHRPGPSDLAQPQPVEQVLGGVGQLGHPLLTKRAGQSLQGVRVTEDGVEQLGVRVFGPGLEEEQAPAERLGGLGGLGGELGRRTLGTHAILRYCLSRAWRCSSPSGFTRNSLAPSCSPRSRSCSRPSVVTMNSGVWR